MKLKLTTKTPVFTGDIKQKSEHIRETSVIGSMRWWYEALVRGFGGSACDATKDGFKCPLKSLPEHLCDACYLFGATRQAKRFLVRVESEDGNTVPDDRIVVKGLTEQGWYLPPGWHGKFSLFFKGLRGNSDIELLLKVLLKLQANWSGVGARNYLGYGVFSLLDENEQPVNVTDCELQQFFDFLDKPRDNRRMIEDSSMKHLPSLRKMFFYKLTFNLSFIESVLSTRKTEIHSKGKATTPLQLRGYCNDLNVSRLVDECYTHDRPFIPTAAHVRYSLRQLFRGQRINQAKNIQALMLLKPFFLMSSMTKNFGRTALASA